MQYLLLINDDLSERSDDELDELIAEYGQFTQAVQDSGALVGANQLQPGSTATVVSVRDGETILTDGPFAETKEVLGGYYLVDVETLDEAIEWAAKIPSARIGHIEVRPVVMRSAEVSA